jgi:CubicO group peptidase (beta-lactamase class C family)
VKTGWGDQFMHVPADPRAQCRIGSNTKAFTAVVLLQLEQEGKLSLDDTVAKWLPGAVTANGNDGTKITIRELLNHTSERGPVWNHSGLVLGYQSLWLSSADGRHQVVVASNVYNMTTASLGLVDFNSVGALGTAAVDAFCAGA